MRRKKCEFDSSSSVYIRLATTSPVCPSLSHRSFTLHASFLLLRLNAVFRVFYSLDERRPPDQRRLVKSFRLSDWLPVWPRQLPTVTQCDSGVAKRAEGAVALGQYLIENRNVRVETIRDDFRGRGRTLLFLSLGAETPSYAPAVARSSPFSSSY